jgi:hypothetical protein
MSNGLAPHFIVEYVGPSEILHKLHPNVYTLELLINFVTHRTFHVLKLELFLQGNQRPNWKQKVKLEVDAIEHRLVAKIKGILCAKVNMLHM